jgi:hypothetical protein
MAGLANSVSSTARKTAANDITIDHAHAAMLLPIRRGDSLSACLGDSYGLVLMFAGISRLSVPRGIDAADATETTRVVSCDASIALAK